MITRMKFDNATRPILNVINSINGVQFGGIDLQPTYQRAYIWKNEFKDKLLYSIIKQYPIGNISVRYLNEPNEKGAHEEVVDGQQRLTTIFNFVNGDYIIRSEWSKKIIEEIERFLGPEFADTKYKKLLKKKDSKGYPRVSFDDLPEVIKGNINAFNISTTSISNATDDEIREYFRFLQNQEILRAGEIIKSLPATNLECYLEKILDKAKFLSLIGFEDDRREFDKIFYSIIGLFEEKIMFGITDKQIQKYTRVAEEPTKALKNINSMLNAINYITENFNEPILAQTRKRFLKFFLLLSALDLLNFSEFAENKLITLKKIDDSLASFFSAKLDAVKEEFGDIDQKIIVELNSVAMLTKNAHPLSRVKNRMEILAHYVNKQGAFNEPSNIEIE